MGREHRSAGGKPEWIPNLEINLRCNADRPENKTTVHDDDDINQIKSTTPDFLPRSGGECYSKKDIVPKERRVNQRTSKNNQVTRKGKEEPGPS